MPTRLLSVPHSPQIEDAGCLGACAQMVLCYLDREYSQARLNAMLGLTSIGTPYGNVRRLADLGLSVALGTGGDNDLRLAVDQGVPPIAFVMTGDLPYWSANTSHAVVVVGYDDQSILLNDPMFDEAPQRVSWGDFMLAWSEQDFFFAIISP